MIAICGYDGDIHITNYYYVGYYFHNDDLWEMILE